MEWLLDNYIGLLIAITLFMIYASWMRCRRH